MNSVKKILLVLLIVFIGAAGYSSDLDVEGDNPFFVNDSEVDKASFKQMFMNLWHSTGIYYLFNVPVKTDEMVAADLMFESMLKEIKTEPYRRFIYSDYVSNVVKIKSLMVDKETNAAQIEMLIEKNSEFWGRSYYLFVQRPQGDMGIRFTRDQVEKIGNAIRSVISEVEHEMVERAGVPGWQRILMILISMLLLYLAISKGFEPLLLIPIGFGGLLSNIPIVGISEVIDGSTGFLKIVFDFGISSGLFPLLIFLGVGAMIDFGPLIANPKTLLLGAGAQLGIFTTLMGALLVSEFIPGINFSLKDACSIGIIGGADGPTAIFLASRLSPNLLGAIAVAAYSYMALVPVIQPPVMKLMTTKKQRMIKMKQLRHVSKIEKIIFPLGVIILCILLLPSATPLIGMLMLGNLFRESGVVERLNKTAQNELINIVTILLGLSVGTKLAADKFLSLETLGILFLGCLAFMVGTAGGVGVAHILNLFSKNKMNPLIGSAGVSAVPMAARVVNKVGQESDPSNFLLMHAMGPNVSGVIGSATVAGILLSIF